MRIVESDGMGNNGAGKLMRIGALARKAGTTMRTIRYYEERGLLSPRGRTKGGFRLYENEELRKLHLIRSLQQLDIPLAQVKAFFDQRSKGKRAAEIAPGLRQTLQGQFDALEAHMQRCRAMQESIRQTMDILRSCAQCVRVPGPESCESCPVIGSVERLPLHMQAIVETA